MKLLKTQEILLKKVKKMDNFIPIWEYAKKHNITQQTVYRLIRERRFDEDDVKVVEKIVKRKMIFEDAKKML